MLPPSWKPHFVRNETAAPPKSGMTRLYANFGGVKIRHEVFEGRDHAVVPMVMLVEGVHNGSSGPILYERTDIDKFPGGWNHKPVVINHPEIDGMDVSACDPEVLKKYKVGMIFSTQSVGGKLKAEAWLDVQKANAVDWRVLNALEAGKMVEISTGLFMDVHNADGEWNGEKYVGIARNYRPDHLAILPDGQGACSIADGAGLLRNEASHDAIRSMLWTALNTKFPTEDTFVEDVFDNFFVFFKDGKLYRQRYLVGETEIAFTGEVEEVVRVTQYVTLTGDVVGNVKESTVDKTKVVDALIANGAWTDSDKGFLMSLSEDQLTKITEKKKEDPAKATDPPSVTPPLAADPAASGAPAGVADPVPAVVAPVVAPDAVPVPAGNAAPINNTSTPPTVDEYVANAPGPIKHMLAAGLRAHGLEKKRLIDIIVGNARNTLTQVQLAAMEIDQLQSIADLAAPNDVSELQPSYAGLAEAYAPTAANNAADPVVAPMELPTLGYEDSSKK